MERSIGILNFEKANTIKIRPLRYGNGLTKTFEIPIKVVIKIRPLRYGNNSLM